MSSVECQKPRPLVSIVRLPRRSPWEKTGRPSSVVCLLLACAAAGCASPPKEPVLFTQAQVKAIGQSARMPNVFGITVYPSENGTVFKGGNRLHESQKAQVPFKSPRKSTAPVVELLPPEPKGFRVLIDTSSRENWINLDASQKANITLLGQPLYNARAEHVDESIGGTAGLAPQLRFKDQLFLEDTIFYVQNAFGPLGPESRSETNARPDAVIGMSLLRNFSYVQLDFPQREVVLASTKKYAADETRLIAKLPMLDVKGALACDAVIDGEPATVIIDTGGDFELAMKDAPLRPLRQVSVGDLVARQAVASDSEALGLGLIDYPRFGRKVLARFKITLDFKNKLIWVESPAK